ncbi:MAG: hypothetical protein WKF41_13255 [Gaiellaceae bacterium]
MLESESLRHAPPRPDGERRFRLFAVAALILFSAYVAATLVGAPREASSLIFSVVLLPVPFVGWWAYVRVAERLRSTFLLCAWAATLWLAGSLVWYGFFVAGGSEVPPSPGLWDVFFVGARLLLIAAVIAAMRSFVSFTIAALDACVIIAAGIGLGAAFIGRGLEDGLSLATLVTLNRPVLGIVTLMLIASAALGSSEGMPRSIVLLGLGEIGLTIGSLIYGYAAVQGEFVDDRWANLAWAAGAGFSMLAASVVILGVDRPVLLAGKHRLPGHAAGSRAVLLVTLVAIGNTLGVATYGLVTDRGSVAMVGLAASVAIAVAMALRARDSIGTAERSSELLDRALAESEHARDQLHLANEKLQRTNASLRTLQVVVAQGFDLIDERTQGRLRELVDEAGDDLAALVDETLDDVER